jgi:dolichol-phosphate mannosyltransferase
MDEKTLLSVVVPVFDESSVIDVFYKRMKKVVDSLPSSCYEIIFIDDGSKDASYQKLVALARFDHNIKVVKFSRNFGHQIAITAGVDIAKGDAVVVIDSDLQDPPEVIIEFIDKWEQGYDVVYGVRKKRKGENKMKLITASIFYRLLRLLITIDVPVDTGDFRLMSRRVVDKFKDLNERDRFVRGLVSWMGYKQIGVQYERDKRYAGKTKYPYKKMIKFAIDGITSFSSVPLKVASWLGYLTSLFAFLYAINIFIQKIMGYTVKGLATVVIGMLFLGGVQLICLGIIGEYIGRIFTETKQRPMYVIEQIYCAQSADDTDSHSTINEPCA